MTYMMLGALVNRLNIALHLKNLWSTKKQLHVQYITSQHSFVYSLTVSYHLSDK